MNECYKNLMQMILSHRNKTFIFSVLLNITGKYIENRKTKELSMCNFKCYFIYRKQKLLNNQSCNGKFSLFYCWIKLKKINKY